MVKDIVDMDADRKVALSTLPLRYGIAKTSRIVASLVLLTVITSLLPSVRENLGVVYSYAIIIIDGVLLSSAFRLYRNTNLKSANDFLALSAFMFPCALMACLL